MYCQKDDINVICELLAVKHGDLELDLFSNYRFWMLLLSSYVLTNFYGVFIFLCTLVRFSY